MASFSGFLDEGLVLIAFAAWWLYNIMKSHIKSLEEKTPYQTELSYISTIRGRQVPLEIILKIALPFCGFWAICFDHNFVFLDKDGNFFDQTGMQQMTIYAMFTVHGVSDLLDYLNVTSLREMKFITFGAAIGWYGGAFSFHGKTVPETTHLEHSVYTLPMPLMFLCTVVVLVEIFNRSSLLIQLVRCYIVLTIGTWFFYSAIILHTPSPFPGKSANPRWDQNSERNTHFNSTAFGIHLLTNTVVILAALFSAERYRKCRKGTSQGKGHVGSMFGNEKCMNAEVEIGNDSASVRG